MIELVPPFVSVAVFCPPIWPTFTDTQLSDVGLTVAVPPVEVPPVPESAAVCVPPLSATLRVAERLPVVLGLNETEMLQFADAARLVPQVFDEIRKSPAFVPPTLMLLMLIDELVPFVTVVVSAPLVEPTFTVPNESDVGLIVTLPLVPPGAYPDSATVCGLGVAESSKFSVAVRVPLTVGANVMFAVQLAPAARLAPHVFEKILKSCGSTPVIATLLIEIELVPLFVSVATFWPPTEPMLTEAQLRLVGDTVAASASSGNATHATNAKSTRDRRRKRRSAVERSKRFAASWKNAEWREEPGATMGTPRILK